MQANYIIRLPHNMLIIYIIPYYQKRNQMTPKSQLKYHIQPTLFLFLLISIVICLPNPAPYIRQKGRPLNIAHRGLSSILPENTLQAFEAALYQGADFIELDIVYTKEKLPLVMHDPYLTRITNIKQLSQFSTRYQTRVYNGKNKTDWWTDNFTINQLKRMGIKQDQAPGRISIFDYKFTFPTLDQVIQMVIKFNQQHKGKRNPDGRLAGILIQAKDSQMYRDLYGLQIGQTILQTLKKYNISTIAQSQKVAPIYLHSFDYGTIKYWASHTQLPRNYLMFNGQDFNLTDINKYATGIGFQDSIIWDYSKNLAKDVLNKTKQLGMIVHIWTFKDDVLLFNVKNNIDMYTIGQNQMKLDGIITEFCDVYAPIAQILRKQNQKSQPLQNQVNMVNQFLANSISQNLKKENFYSQN